MSNSPVAIPIIVAVAVAAAGLLSSYVLGSVVYLPDGASLLVGRLQEMALLALVIERSVEVYLRVFNQNGPDRNDPDQAGSPPRQSASQVAAMAGLVVGILVALLGVRLMDSFITFTSDQWLPMTLWNGIDVVVSGALLAGGAVFIHEIVETLVGGIRSVNEKISPAGKENAGGPAASAPAAPPAPVVVVAAAPAAPAQPIVL